MVPTLPQYFGLSLQALYYKDQSGVWCEGNKETSPILPPGAAFPTPPTDNKHQPETNYWSLTVLGAGVQARASPGAQETARFHLELVLHSSSVWSD